MYTKTRAELRKTLDEIKSAGLYKQERLLDSPQAPHVESGDRDLLNFCSNNYLGLANHP
ncbi:MAG: glycine C-acetyltransferase, partial [Actinobacteria bacterium]|nr:glycine C-acetyltransferase [Actinomycetota bacterium]